MPSARIWLATAAQEPLRCPAVAPAALIAGPGLPGADREVRLLAERRLGAVVLTGAAATAAATLAAIDGATLAHIACHGTPRADAPLFSALHLADGPLTVYDLERVPRPPAVLVLAACDAGQLTGDRGSDPLGFPSVLLQRGTRALLAAHVAVPDLDATALLVGLHDELLAGRSSAEALAAARVRIDTADPPAYATSLAFTCFGGG